MFMAPELITSLPVLKTRVEDGHKGLYGTVLVIAGGRGMAGAAALCGASALRSGRPGPGSHLGRGPAHGGQLRALLHDLSSA